MSDNPFSVLKLNTALVSNLTSLGYLEMTPIQAQSLPSILEGKDVIAQAKTGSGKTAAFSLGLLEKLDVKNFGVQGLILCPTRELADQVANEIRKLGRTIPNIKVLTLCGGSPFAPQAGSLEFGAHIVVGTPGRVEDHLTKGTLKLDALTTFVLDEADRMLEMGFQPALDAIIKFIPDKRQSLLFSATFPPEIQSIAKRIMQQPVMVKVEATHDNTTIKQCLFTLDDSVDRLTALRLLLLQYRPESALVFCNTKKVTQEVTDDLARHGFSVLALHGDLEQRDRDQTLVQFVNKSVSILVATDVAARGLDIDALDAVINYELAHEADIHVHRIGRTGRAGSNGVAYTLCHEKENYKLNKLEAFLGYKLEGEALPSMSILNTPGYKASMATLLIDGGKKQKLRAGDILGALTGENGIDGKQVGKIQLFDNRSYVAVSRGAVKTALNKLEVGKLKGRSFRVRAL